MRIDWWTLALQVINLLVLLAILGRFLFRPMAQIVADRQAEAAKLLADAQAAKDKAEAADRDAQGRLDAVGKERDALVAAANKQAEAERAALLDEARADVAHQRSEAASQIRRLKHAEETRVGRRANALATDIAARLLEGPGAKLPLAAFLGGFEAALAALPEAARAAAGADGAPLDLTTARALDEGELAAVREVLVRVLGHAVELAPRVDPALIAGLSLTADSLSVDASLRADLDRVLAGLDADENAADGEA